MLFLHKKFNKLLSEMGYDNLWRLIEHCNADNGSKNNEVVNTENDLHERLKRAVEKQMQITVNDLAINGKDLIELGFTGTEIGQIKKELLDKYLSEELQNEKEEIIKIIFPIFIKLAVNIGPYTNGKICFFKIYPVGIPFKIAYFTYSFCFCDITEFFKILA